MYTLHILHFHTGQSICNVKVPENQVESMSEYIKKCIRLDLNISLTELDPTIFKAGIIKPDFIGGYSITKD